MPGGFTRPGVLVRSDNIGSLNTEGQEAMVAYGVTTVIDLRSESEVANQLSPNQISLAPSGERERGEGLRSDGSSAPRGYRPTYIHLPLIDDSTMRRLAEAPSMFDRYLMMLEHRQAAFGEIFKTLAHSDGTVVFHCFAGKDRTGLVAAMSLALAGVGVDAIAADYAETDSQMAARYEAWLAASPPEKLQEMRDDLRCPPERIIGVLEHLEERWGGAEAYLEAAGLSSAAITRLRSKLADSTPD
jgi:protein-tyrosine phosphatase